MNVGLNLADMVRQLVVPNVTHLHQNQVSLLTMHSTDSQTDMYMQIIRPHVCVCIHTCIYLNVSIKFKYLLPQEFPLRDKNPKTKFCSLIME